MPQKKKRGKSKGKAQRKPQSAVQRNAAAPRAESVASQSAAPAAPPRDTPAAPRSGARRGIYDLAVLSVMVWLGVMLLGVGSRMLTYTPEPVTENSEVTEENADIVWIDPDVVPREERDRLRDRDGVVWTIITKWPELYPEKEAPAADATAIDRFADWIEDTKARTDAYEEPIEALEQYIDDYATDYAPGYEDMVAFANRYDELLGWDIVSMESYNPVVMAEENYFITCVPRQDRSERAAEIVALRDYCAALGMKHLYVTTPNDACRYDTGISNVTDFYNQNADRLQKALRDAGVETIDLRDELHAAGMDHHASFFQTDHHWLPETGRWAASCIAQRLNEDYGFAIDLSLFAPERWRSDVYRKWFLGSQGKKVTLARATPEDFSLLYPKFPADFHIEIPSLDVDKSGSFAVFYRTNALRKRDYYKQMPYSAYLYGDQALTRIHNLLCDNGQRVLVLGHSFDNCVIPFLALGVEYVDSIDLRVFDGSLETYLEQNHYDVVIEIYTE